MKFAFVVRSNFSGRIGGISFTCRRKKKKNVEHLNRDYNGRTNELPPPPPKRGKSGA